MLVRLLYVSRAEGPQTAAVTGAILAEARAFNRQYRITGVLCQAPGLYLQVLEGERSAINRVYARILADRRHKDVELLCFEEITHRRYPDWSMAHLDLPEGPRMARLAQPDFDPFSANGATVMALVDDLVARQHPVPPPAS